MDARSDIFSFGAVLYEMVTGRRAFGGDSKLSTLASVLHSEPAPLSQNGDGVPRDVERIISRCLRKDPLRRWQSMADVKVALEDALEELESGKLGAAEGGCCREAAARFSTIAVAGGGCGRAAGWNLRWMEGAEARAAGLRASHISARRDPRGEIFARWPDRGVQRAMGQRTD